MAKKALFKKNEEAEHTPPPDDNSAEWLVSYAMTGVQILCSHCRAQLHAQNGTVVSNLIKNKYCYNCGYKMIIRDNE